jgi:hypothetical protein
MRIIIKDESHTIEIELNTSSAARSLLKRLPLAVTIQNYGDCEKTFFLEGLDVSSAEEGNCPAGTLAYYAPWGKVALLYENFSAFPELYVLGSTTAGTEYIGSLKGTVHISEYSES